MYMEKGSRREKIFLNKNQTLQGIEISPIRQDLS